MKTTDNQLLKTNYAALFCHHVQSLVFRRNNLRISQQHMAHKIGVSLRTIQNFENYKCQDAYLIWAYKQIFNKPNATHQ